jgi:uncharacterized membrane protein YagU involved in acid resistance
MSQFHSLLQKKEPSSQQDKEDSTVRAASAVSRGILGRDLTDEQKKIAAPLVHYLFGASIAAVYGTAVEFVPDMCAGSGLVFGATVWLGAHVIAVPLLGFSEPVTESTARSEAVEAGAHLLYGATVEGVRRISRMSLRCR